MLSARSDNKFCARTVARLSAPRGRPAGFPLSPFWNGIALISSYVCTHEKPATRPRGAVAQQKTRRGTPPGASWRSFGEYALLKDSRYMSQAENSIIGKPLDLQRNVSCAAKKADQNRWILVRQWITSPSRSL
jgi:hypothetical protein